MVDIDNIQDRIEDAEAGDEISITLDEEVVDVKVQARLNKYENGEANGIEWTTNPKAQVYQGDVGLWVTGNDHDINDIVNKLTEYGGLWTWSSILNDVRVQIRVLSGTSPALHGEASGEDEQSDNLLLFKTSPLRDHDFDEE